MKKPLVRSFTTQPVNGHLTFKILRGGKLLKAFKVRFTEVREPLRAL